MKWSDNPVKKIGASLWMQSVPIEPLALFRILFGLMMTVGTLRFMLLGWVDAQWVDPVFHFKYYGFEWVEPLPRVWMYVLYCGMLLSSILIMAGFYYRYASVFFFLSFTYTELIDKTYYLNHYYFISIVALLMCLLPANRKYALDVYFKRVTGCDFVPAWSINIIRFQVALVYCFAGLAKLNPDWLIHAMPLKIWLPAQSHLPLIGHLFEISWMPHLFSWLGAVYDLFLPFVLLSRFWYIGFAANIVFHVLTGIFFQIGMFPLIMICAVTVFFPVNVHYRLFSFFQNQKEPVNPDKQWELKPVVRNILFAGLGLHIVFQLIFPWRFVCYPGNMYWTEQGYRFGWRVMLVEKAGSATFFVKDGINGREGAVVNSEFLNATQEKQMAMQPDMILEFAHFLGNHFRNSGMKNPQVRAEVYVSMHGQRSRLLIDSSLNLLSVKESMAAKNWILPFKP